MLPTLQLYGDSSMAMHTGALHWQCYSVLSASSPAATILSTLFFLTRWSPASSLFSTSYAVRTVALKT